MFDDYDYKLAHKRIRFKFEQIHDEPMFPWELARFLKELNTIYYKYELLNSISTAIKQKISPKEIFIFNKSLPLNKSYANLNLLDIESRAIPYFYFIGIPFPLFPSKDKYEIGLLYGYFNLINKKLYSAGCRTLYTKALSKAYAIYCAEGIGAAEYYILSTATKVAEQKNIDSIVSEKDFNSYNKKKQNIYTDFDKIKDITPDKIDTFLADKENAKLKYYFNVFTRLFHNTTRPLVCVKVSDSAYRVLGRSLVNKTEKNIHGLELKEVVRNSPLGSLLEGGVSVYRAIKEEQRADELHAEEMELMRLKKAKIKEEIDAAEYIKLQEKVKLGKELQSLADNSDVNTISSLPDSYIKEILREAYAVVDSKRSHVLEQRGLKLLPDETKVIDIKV